MPTVSDTLDALLRLGERLSEAIEAEDWARVADLAERRSEVTRQLPAEGEPIRDTLSGGAEKKIDALTDQNDRLATLLREQRDEIERELAQLEQLRHAQDSYQERSSREGVLPDELSG